MITSTKSHHGLSSRNLPAKTNLHAVTALLTAVDHSQKKNDKEEGQQDKKPHHNNLQLIYPVSFLNRYPVRIWQENQEKFNSLNQIR